MRRRSPALTAAVALAGASMVALATTAVAAPPSPDAGSTSGGDPYFPAAGNGGYEVGHYDLDLRYTPATKALTARAQLRATATQRLSSFSLDLRDLTVSSVRVNERPAAFRQQRGELIITPSGALAAGAFTVDVRYAGTTGQPKDNTGALYGWVSYADGAFVANEPEGASTWYPVNDVPYDKATYDFTITVPDGTVAVANGLRLEETRRGGWTTSRWSARDPMASYLSMAASGDYVVSESTTAGGIPILDAVDEDIPAAEREVARQRLARQGEMIDFFAGYFGPYPFETYGAVIDDDEDAGYALENQTRPIYSGVPSESTIAHELSHMWYGDSVTPRQWPDIWLNEGFATYAEWMWDEHDGGPKVQERFDSVYAIPANDRFWRVPPGEPGAKGLFAASVYDRGGAFLHALRLTIGDEDYFRLLLEWAQQHANGVVDTTDLLAHAERISGDQLDALFEAWLYTPGKPPAPAPAP